MKTKKTLLLTLAAFSLLSVVASCGNKTDGSSNGGHTAEKGGVWEDDGVQHTLNSYVTLSPSNWNELTYQDNNDTEILSYCVSSFFEFDYKKTEDNQIVDGEYTVSYSAATKLEDVSADYAGQYGLPTDAKKGDSRAFKITLRDDLAWDDGTKITAEDFVYSMKEQLNPLFKNYRADSFYNSSTVIHNAKNYVYQGSYALTNFFDSMPESLDGYPAFDKFTKDANGGYVYNGEDVYINTKDGGQWGTALSSYISAYAAKYPSVFGVLNDAIDDDGYIRITDSTLLALQNAIAMLHEYDDVAAYAKEEGSYAYVECEEMFMLNRLYKEMDFSEVGIFKGASDNELVLVLDKGLNLLNEDGSLNYRAAYNMNSLPLVKKSLYESCKVAPTTTGGLWTSIYNSSLTTSASWGPYKLTGFQQDQSFTLSRNEKWFGYQSTCDIYGGTYETDTIYNRVIAEWNTAFLSFQKGELDSVGIDASVASTYKGSEQAIFTPSDFVASLQLQSSEEALKNRETTGVCKTILANEKFRKALSLSIDRNKLATTCTTSSKAGYGLFNSRHYNDVENGSVYRNTDAAKQTLCDVYGVDTSKYDSLTDAAESITGYNLSLAKQYLTEAITEAKTAGNYHDGDKVVLDMGTGAVNESVTRIKNTLLTDWTELVKGTELEGKFEVTLTDKGSSWSKDFRAGSYDICIGGWTGAAWDPGYFLLAYLDSNYMYSAAWDTEAETLKFKLPDVEGETSYPEKELPLLTWYAILNGGENTLGWDWSSGQLPESRRVYLIAALEKAILNACYTVPLYNSYSASLISYKVDYVSRDYNTFMGYGGIEYTKFNYSDADWAEHVSSLGGTIDYTVGA